MTVQSDRTTSLTAAYLVLRRQSQADGRTEILMLERKNTGYFDGHWSLPAGHLEANESPTQGMSREALEEVGLAIQPHELQVIHTMWRSAPDAAGGRVDFYLAPLITVDEESIQNMEPDKCAELRWFPIEKLPSNTIPKLLVSISHIIQGQAFSEIHIQ